MARREEYYRKTDELNQLFQAEIDKINETMREKFMLRV